MSDKEFIEPRHATRGRDTTRAAAVQAFADANEESGFGRRAMIRNSMIAAVVASLAPGIVLFRGLAPFAASPTRQPGRRSSSHTMWKEGMRLAHDPEGTPIRAADVTLGSAVHVIPEDARRARATPRATSRRRPRPSSCSCACSPRTSTRRRRRADWSYDGIVAYSKVCTHVGCPVALYEQQTHHLLCPCHQSQFDVTERRRGHLRPGRPSPAAASDHRRRRGLPRRAERLHRTRRPELLGAPLSTQLTPRRTSRRAAVTRTCRRPPSENGKPLGGRFLGAHRELHRRAHEPLRASSRSSAARSSPTTGRSCSARSRCGASSSSCCRARS